MLVTEFEQNDRYSVKYFPSNTEGLRELIENKKVHAALFIPPDFDQDIKKGKGTKAALFIDGSNIAIGNNALSSGLEILNTVNGGIHMNLLQAKGVPPRLSKTMPKFSSLNRESYGIQNCPISTISFPESSLWSFSSSFYRHLPQIL